MVELVLRVVFSLAVVFGLIWVVARTSSRKFGGASREMVRVVARQPLARSASLAVVEVGDRVLVVGVSENGVSLLTEMEPGELPVPEAPNGTTDTTGTTGTAVDATGSVPAVALLRSPAPRGGKRRADRPAATGTEGLAVARTAGSGTGLHGSVLSTQTWRQAWSAATSRNGIGSD